MTVKTDKSINANTPTTKIVAVVFFCSSFLCTSFLYSASSHAHRQHFAWTNIIWRNDTQILEFTHRVHLHDAAQWVSKNRNETLDEIEAQAAFALYVEAHFLTYQGGKRIHATTVGVELADPYILIYQEHAFDHAPKNLSFSSNILMPFFKDQMNIVNLEIGQFSETLTFNKVEEILSVLAENN